MNSQVLLVLGLLTLSKVITSARAAQVFSGGYGTLIRGRTGCRNCIVQGKVYETDDQFTYEKGCYRHNCECQCSGWPSCPKEEREYICTQSRENEQRAGLTAQQVGCRDCNVYDVFYKGGQPFSYRQRCIELKDCRCECDGSWNCASGRDICKNEPLKAASMGSQSSSSQSYSSSSSFYSTSSSSDSGSVASKSTSYNARSGYGKTLGSSSDSKNEGSQCRTCSVGDRVIPSNSRFTYKNNCIEYDACFCYCSGSWRCPAESGKFVCSDSGSGSGRLIGVDSGDCRTCDVYGSIKAPNSEFTYRNGCSEWSNCRCNCDGSWNCPPSTFRWMCDNICRQCEVDGTNYDGNSEFIYEKDCITYNPCNCYCNGSWDCPAETGSWTCNDRCRECKLDDGTRYPGNSTFSLRQECWEWDPCTCNCDGSWKCPRENAKWVCDTQCRQCDVYGQTFNGDSDFQLQKDCWQFNCRCDCDGSWNCPKTKTIDTCNINPRTGCHYCDVHGKREEGNSYFSHTDGCIEYKNCLCNCDGSWECPGERAVDTCRRNSTSGCSSCELSGQRIQGNSKFQLKSDCWTYECDCQCNGRWQCSTSPTYTCGTDIDVQGGRCRDCIAAGRTYASRSTFEMQWGCVNYACQCHCDGMWECPAVNAKVVCADLSQYFQRYQIKSISSSPTYWCSPCRINDSLFPGNSQFEYTDGCYKHFFRCYCNGGFRVASSVIDNCAQGIYAGTIVSEKTSSVFLSQTRKCRDCIVNGKRHPARSSFDLRIGCMVYRCQCACTGQPSCQAGRDQYCGLTISLTANEVRADRGSSSTSLVSQGGSTTIVRGSSVTRTETTRGGSSVVVQPRCLFCVVDGKRHPGNSMFDHVRGCIKYRCQCDCRGVAVCRAVSRDCYQQTCQKCQVEGQEVAANSRFTYEKDCKRISCRCECDGTANCVQTEIPNCRQNCVQCVYEGVKRDPYSQFYVESSCERIACQCNCNGEVRCAAPVVTCVQPPQEYCRGCSLLGKYYRAGSDFMLEYGPWRLPCVCECGGYPRCNRSAAEYIEDEAQTERCRSCSVDGRSIAPKSKFTREQRCYLYRCQCFCDGSYNCVSSGIYSCGDRGSSSVTVVAKEEGSSSSGGSTRVTTTSTRTETSRGSSSSSTSRGSSTTISRGTSTSQGSSTSRDSTTSQGSSTSRGSTTSQGSSTSRGSTTSQDSSTSRGSTTSQGSSTSRGSTTSQGSSTSRGSTTSQSSSTSRTSEGSSTSEGSTRSCTPCKVDNVERSPNKPFKVERGCLQYECDCYCNGRYGCRTGKNICDKEKKTDQSTSQDGSTSSSSSTTRTETSSTTFDYEVRQSRVISTEAVQSDGCRKCRQGDNLHSPNAPFTLDDGCKRFRCRCNCDGSWMCPRQIPVNICKSSCQECGVRGKRYKPNTKFVLEYDRCRGLSCTCNCDGRYQCDREVINTCQDEGSNKCRQCQIQNKTVKSESRFTYDEGCYRYDCECKCDGSYNCPSERTRYICDDRTDSSSSSSSASSSSSSTSSESNQGGSSQSSQVGGSSANYVEYSSRSRKFIGRLESSRPYGSRGCKYCVVYGQYYIPNNRFQFDDGCWRFDCDCNCDGSWNCPAERTTDTCRGTRPAGQCRACRRNGKEFQPDTVFEFNENCYRYSCDCACDGSYNCPPSRTKNICNDRCRGCVVKGNSYLPNRKFQYDEGCYRYDCDCNCDGSWNCPAERTINKCNRGSERTRPDGCRQCNAGGGLREPNRKFQYDEGCYRYDCDCDCDGSWNCPAERIINKCDGGSGRQRPDGCRQCNAGGGLREPNRKFQYDEGCYRYDCDCNCDGSWNCPVERTINKCDRG